MDRRDDVCFRRRPLETVFNAVLEDTKALFCLRSSADKGALLAAAFGSTDERNIILFYFKRAGRRCSLFVACQKVFYILHDGFFLQRLLADPSPRYDRFPIEEILGNNYKN